ncbi:MAG: ATP-binding protein, partial [Candidatus Taylorbacteria bacterium]
IILHTMDKLAIGITSINLLVASVVVVILIVLISLKRQKTLANLFFISFGTFVFVWVFSRFLFDVVGDGSVMLVTHMLYFGAALIPVSLLLFIYTFPDTKLTFSKVKLSIILIVSFLVALSVFIPDWVIRSVQYNLVQDTRTITFGSLGYYIYFTYIVSFFSWGIVKMVVRLRLSFEKERAQLELIFLSIVVSCLVGVTCNLILPTLNIFEYFWIGPFFSIYMVLTIAYAIVRYQLFDIKLVITETFTFMLWLLILGRAIFSTSILDSVLNYILLLSVIIIGIFLIRGVIREVEQREHIEALAADLQKANDRLTELDRQKSEFVSFATHQLRAPLTAMKGYASLILEGDMGVVTEETRGAISRIFESTNTLTSIVDDYLNITRIELGSMKYAFETISLRALIEDVIGELKPTINKSGLDFSFTVDNPAANYRVTADRDKLKQVITNLLDNSMKYTPSGWIKVSLTMDKVRHLFIFQIKDSGIGISAETIPLLFQKFGRASNANKVNIKGTGLGLFVAKEIITAHHGTVHVESEGEGKGSTFIVEMEPFAKA